MLRERVVDWNGYPFRVPAIAGLDTLEVRSRVMFFAGENGSGKSTLLEAIASHYGFGPEGGNRNLLHDTTEHNHGIAPLVKALRLSFDVRTGAGFFLRAESFFNAATHIDNLDKEPAFGPPIIDSFGGVGLHEQSHGESFFALLLHKFRRNGLFLLDEPEAALSPQRQLSFLVLMHDTLKRYKDAQFIISTHSPILLGYPEAQIFSFDDGKVHEISYQETQPLEIVRRFVNNREEMLCELLQETYELFPRD
ncbi:MAG TPA: AAA family ATPase [Acidobacteriaceae bacterium]|nr:AAA family ATPase [Acidobacteriaceae bacterium]